MRKVSRIGESPVPSSYHRAEHTLEISASDTQTNANSAGINGTNPKKKGLGTKYFSAVSCLSVRDGEVSGGNNNSMNSAEGEFSAVYMLFCDSGRFNVESDNVEHIFWSNNFLSLLSTPFIYTFYRHRTSWISRATDARGTS